MPRYAKKGCTRADIIEKMLDQLKADGGYDEDMDETDSEQVIQQWLYNCVAYSDMNPQIEKDLSKLEFDWENSEEDFESQKYGKLPDGTSIIWCFAGGDWEFPIHFAVYIDDKDHLRAYMPLDGNVYCPKCKCAYGSCEDAEHEPEEEPTPDWEKMYAAACKRIETR